MSHHLVLVCGAPGSGKTYIGSELSKQIQAVYIDKDTISDCFSGALLDLLGSHKDDRESDIYVNNVKSLEYETLMTLAMENLALKHSVICSAPFGSQLKDDRWLQDVAISAGNLGG